MIGRDLGELGHRGDDEWVRYGLADSDRNRRVRVCDGARSFRDEQLAFRLPVASRTLSDSPCCPKTLTWDRA